MGRCIRAGAWALAFSLAAAGQTPAEKCRIEGTVLNAVSGQPVRKAQVSLTPATGGEPISGATDSHGAYALANVAPGVYKLQISHDGYLSQNYGAKRPGGEAKGDTLELAPGSVKTGIDLQMTPLGAMMGHIRDEDGDPVRQVEITVLAYGYGPSGRSLQVRGNSQTDASGEYRIFDLPPGAYYLYAKPTSAQMPAIAQAGETYPAAYYPNATLPSQAAAIDLAAGQEQRGMDFVLHPIATAFIRGRVIKPAGGEDCTTALKPEPDDASPHAASTRGIEVDTRGNVAARSIVWTGSFVIATNHAVDRLLDKGETFEFRNVPVGSHTLTATCNVGDQEYSVKMAIELEAPGRENLELRPVGPSSVTGQIRIEGDLDRKLSETQVSLDALRGPTFWDPHNQTAGDGQFSFLLPPDVYHINIGAPSELYVKSVTESGRDVRDSGLDLTAGEMSVELQVVLSANGGSIEGSVENGEGAHVTLVPSDPQRARKLSRTAIAGPDGHFAFSTVPPGRYKLFAWEEVDDNAAMYDAEFRKPFEGKGQTVDVTEKQKTTAQLQMIPKTEK
jgi:hypothetical protein